MNKTSTYLATLVGVICVFFIIYSFFFPHLRTVRNDVVQTFLIGAAVFVGAPIAKQLHADGSPSVHSYEMLRKQRNNLAIKLNSSLAILQIKPRLKKHWLAWTL